MNVGTRSLLFGVHQIFIHPWFVAAAWVKLYGWPTEWQIWVAFVVHDWGYWGKPNMDGTEGESHPMLGALIVSALAGETRWARFSGQAPWYYFALMHSRFYARFYHESPSRLCYADKLAIVLTPWWIYLPLARLSGELEEYRALGRDPRGKYAGEGQTGQTARAWHAQMQQFVAHWVKQEMAK